MHALFALQGDDVAPSHPDYEFLHGLLRMHPRYSEKVRGGGGSVGGRWLWWWKCEGGMAEGWYEFVSHHECLRAGSGSFLPPALPPGILISLDLQ